MALRCCRTPTNTRLRPDASWPEFFKKQLEAIQQPVAPVLSLIWPPIIILLGYHLPSKTRDAVSSHHSLNTVRGWGLNQRRLAATDNGAAAGGDQAEPPADDRAARAATAPRAAAAKRIAQLEARVQQLQPPNLNDIPLDTYRTQECHRQSPSWWQYQYNVSGAVQLWATAVATIMGGLWLLWKQNKVEGGLPIWAAQMGEGHPGSPRMAVRVVLRLGLEGRRRLGRQYQDDFEEARSRGAATDDRAAARGDQAVAAPAAPAPAVGKSGSGSSGSSSWRPEPVE
ncbi:hypothetical protein PG985_009647 [Apiospora marii]|uniref:Uncharacterized protein n=1 Tax=Apiospora marii TaxID=335849 RepID=A0ABR1RFT9_9PEZI